MIYTHEQLNKMDAGDISRCSAQHIQSVVKDLIATALAAAPVAAHPSEAAQPIGWIAPRLIESLANYRESAQVPSNFSVAVQAGQRDPEDLPIYAAPTATVSAAPSGEAATLQHIPRYDESDMEGGGVALSCSGPYVKLTDVLAAITATKE